MARTSFLELSRKDTKGVGAVSSLNKSSCDSHARSHVISLGCWEPLPSTKDVNQWSAPPYFQSNDGPQALKKTWLVRDLRSTRCCTFSITTILIIKYHDSWFGHLFHHDGWLIVVPHHQPLSQALLINYSSWWILCSKRHIVAPVRPIVVFFFFVDCWLSTPG